jgi:hypothetical protein
VVVFGRVNLLMDFDFDDRPFDDVFDGKDEFYSWINF